jgi:hypothetical protein
LILTQAVADYPVRYRVGGQQQGELAQVQLIDAQEAAEVLQGQPTLPGLMEPGQPPVQAVVDEAGGQPQQEVALQGGAGALDLEAVGPGTSRGDAGRADCAGRRHPHLGRPDPGAFDCRAGGGILLMFHHFLQRDAGRLEEVGMSRRIAVFVAVVFGLHGAAGLLHADLPLSILAVPGLPSPNDVVKVLDALTRKESDTTFDIKVGSTVSQGKLLIARTRLDVVMERTSRNWRGRVHVLVTVPSDVSYSLDLAEIRPEHISTDARLRVILVTMPGPRVENVTPRLSELHTENTFKHGRFRRYDADVARGLQSTMLQQDYQERARKQAESQLPKIREQAREALQEFLEKLLRATCPGLRVVVE